MPSSASSLCTFSINDTSSDHLCTQAALAEISRVLRPGGVFVASTFMVPTAPLGQLLGSDDAVRPLTQVRCSSN